MTCTGQGFIPESETSSCGLAIETSKTMWSEFSIALQGPEEDLIGMDSVCNSKDGMEKA